MVEVNIKEEEDEEEEKKDEEEEEGKEEDKPRMVSRMQSIFPLRRIF